MTELLVAEINTNLLFFNYFVGDLRNSSQNILPTKYIHILDRSALFF